MVICMFNFLGNCQTGFQSGSAILNSHQWYMRILRNNFSISVQDLYTDNY